MLVILSVERRISWPSACDSSLDAQNDTAQNSCYKWCNIADDWHEWL